MSREVLLLGAAGWHGRELARALAPFGMRGRRTAWNRLALGTGGCGLLLGRGRGLPGAVLVRSIPAGSFEQVTLRLSLLHALGELGVPVVNSARAIERCVDKAMTVFLLQRAGLPVPPSWTTEDPALAQRIVAAQTLRGRSIVQKPLFGSQGRGLRRLRSATDLPPPAEVAGVYHLQLYVGTEAAHQDFRVLVIDGEAVAAMRRVGAGWITNLRQGGRAEAVACEGELARLAIAAAAAVGAVYAGVDLIRDPAGRLQLLEVNSMPAWQGLQSVTPERIADRLAAAIARRLELARARAA